MKARNGMSLKEASEKAADIARDKKKKRIEKYALCPSKCKKCENTLPYEKRKNLYCCHSCAAAFNNLGVKRYTGNGIVKWISCEKCGKKTTNNKFCSQACCIKNKRDELLEYVKTTGCVRNAKRDIKFLKEIFGSKCITCGNSMWMGRQIILHAHHVDGNTDNNKIANIQLLCPNCHSFTDNYGSKNKNGKMSRKKLYRNTRYKSGLSH